MRTIQDSIDHGGRGACGGRRRQLTQVVVGGEREQRVGKITQVLPLSEEDAEFVARARSQVQDILWNRDPRMMVVIGPCSIHDPEAALDYAERLARLNRELQDQYPDQFTAGMGAETIKELLARVDVEVLARELREKMRTERSQQKRPTRKRSPRQRG